MLFLQDNFVIDLRPVFLRRLLTGEKLRQPGLELQVGIQFAQLGFVRSLALQLIGPDVQIHIAFDGHQLTRERQTVQAPAQVLSDLAADLVGGSDDAVKRAVFLQPLDGRLRPDLWNPGNVVHRVADESQIVDHLFGSNAELALHPLRIEAAIVHRIDHGHGLIDELCHILIAGRYGDVESTILALLGEGSDDVVGFDAGHLQQRHAECFHQRSNCVELLPHLIRHGWAVSLVFGIEIVAKGFPFRIEDHCQVRWIVIRQKSA